MTDYLITQIDRTLSSVSIKLVKYENKVSRLKFALDGTIPEGLRLYCAFLNPKTKKYFFTPVLYEDDTPYVIIGTEITFYVGKWEMLLLGISPDSNLMDQNELDDTMIVWSSTSFKRIVVLNTFIDDDAVQITHPNIEKAMNDLVSLHEDVLAFADQVSADRESITSMLHQIETIYADIQSIDTSLTERYNSLMNSMTATYNQYIEDLRREREGG